MGFIYGLDPLYWLLIGPTILLALWAQMKVKSNFSKFSKYTTANRLSGAEAAEAVLRYANIHDVKIEEVRGFLSDHYDPRSRTLRLSPDVFRGKSISAAGVAAHEAGHAIQHAKGYGPLKLRSMLVPTAGIGSNLGYIVMLMGLIFASQNMVMVGAVLFSAVLLFQIVTLPVEFDASNRAKALVVDKGIVGIDERRGMDKVLNAAAMTYVAAVASSLATLLYFLVRSGLLGGSRD